MNAFNPNWTDITARQEAALRFAQPISNRDALTIGLSAVEEAERLGYAVAVRVITRGAIVFSHHMDGVGLENDWWMDKKLNTARETGLSTLRLFSEVQAGLREAPACLEYPRSYAIEGGCVPMRTEDGHVFGYMLVSGSPHEYDHEIIVRSLARFLGVDVPSLFGEQAAR